LLEKSIGELERPDAGSALFLGWCRTHGKDKVIDTFQQCGAEEKATGDNAGTSLSEGSNGIYSLTGKRDTKTMAFGTLTLLDRILSNGQA
jgi:hypothetical protein